MPLVLTIAIADVLAVIIVKTAPAIWRRVQLHRLRTTLAAMQAAS